MESGFPTITDPLTYRDYFSHGLVLLTAARGPGCRGRGDRVVILVLISPYDADLPFAQWLSEESGRLVAVTAAGAEVGDGFAEVVTVADYTDDDAVLDAARGAAKRHRPRAILALAEIDVDRAAVLRGELSLPGL